MRYFVVSRNSGRTLAKEEGEFAAKAAQMELSQSHPDERTVIMSTREINELLAETSFPE